MLSGQLDEYIISSLIYRKEIKFLDFKRSVGVTAKDMKNMKSTFSGKRH
jgi:hypothetical protein